ncbi:EAL domain-containing protein, partial [Pseudomonas syringae]
PAHHAAVHRDTLASGARKIDRGLVAQMRVREVNRKQVNARINLAHNLNLDGGAEGGETAGRLEVLRSFGCKQVRGYLISRPLPVEELVTYLRAQAVHADTSRSW